MDVKPLTIKILQKETSWEILELYVKKTVPEFGQQVVQHQRSFSVGGVVSKMSLIVKTFRYLFI